MGFVVALVMRGLATADGTVPPTVAAPTNTTDAMQVSEQVVPTGASSHMVAPSIPTEPGQGAFGALHEIVRILEADPRIDWSKVDLDALREHLI